ncbi:hypothetical protein [Aliivibrio fischeri]|uniref:hypothetical protein n=1 Tax=Aliivibrio fischeri TaxID=668 RepID=UPI0007C4CA1A|nr:hypothetical protein [Aliivibrio fischeri]
MIALYIALVFCITVFLILKLKKTNNYPQTPYGFKAKLLFLDDGSSRGFAFFNRSLNVGATPDAIYKKRNRKDLMLELKSRKGPVYESDIAQAKAGVLATNGKYAFDQILIKTSTHQRFIDLPRSMKTLEKELMPLIKLARNIKQGKVVTQKNISRNKCMSCRHFKTCNPKI